MPQGSDQVGPLVGIDEDVPYSAADANALAAACRPGLVSWSKGEVSRALRRVPEPVSARWMGRGIRVGASASAPPPPLASPAPSSTPGLLGVSRTALKAVFQAACLVARCSSSTSLGVLYPRAEWSRF